MKNLSRRKRVIYESINECVNRNYHIINFEFNFDLYYETNLIIECLKHDTIFEIGYKDFVRRGKTNCKQCIDEEHLLKKSNKPNQSTQIIEHILEDADNS
jgi:hypothetical protein